MRNRIPYSLLAWINGAACGLAVGVNLWAIVLLCDEPFSVAYRLLFLLATACIAVVGRRFALTTPWLPGRPGSIGSRMLRAWAIIVGVLLMLIFLSGSADLFSRLVILIWALTTPPLLLALNELVMWSMRRLLSQASRRRTAVLVSVNDAARTLARQLRESGSSELVGFFGDSKGKSIEGLPYLGAATAAPRYVRDHDIDTVFVVLSSNDNLQASDVVNELDSSRASVYLVMDFLLIDVLRAQIRDVEGVPVLALRGTPFYGPDGTLKRWLDLALALLALPLLLPLILITAVLAAFVSRGSIIARERRYAFDGRRFWLYRFRSAASEGEAGSGSIGRLLGHFIHRTALDELPQLYNVLRGDLSLVGPKAHSVAHNEHYRRAMLRHMIHHRIRPGVTGLAQIRGLRSDAAQANRIDEAIRLDLDYIRRWSPLLDFKIVIASLANLLRGRNVQR